MTIPALLALWSSLAIADTCSPVDAAFPKVQEDVERRIHAYAQKKGVAEESDAMLGKLIEAKSPLVSGWMQKNRLGDKSEDEIVRAWRDYYARNFHLAKYPQGNSVDRESEALVDGLLKDHLKPEFKRRLEKLFSRVQEAAMKRLESYEFPQRTEAADRLRAVKLFWPEKLKTARNNKLPLDLVEWGIAYDPPANGINVGLQALGYPNDETLLAVFAHELGHALDSCRWGAFLSGKWPFEKVGDCLRSPESVGAKKRDDSSLAKWKAEGKIPGDVADSLLANPTCNRTLYPPEGMQADQLPESFADWFSAEVLGSMKGVDFKRVRADLCADRKLSQGSSYPGNQARLDRIYRANPAFGQKGNQPSKYCAFTP